MKTKSRGKKEIQVIGWREWVSLPALGIKKIKAKVDTGARSSSIHAFDLKFYERFRNEYVEFKVHPDQDDTRRTVLCKAKVLERRKVKSSDGRSQLRPVIQTELTLLGSNWPIEITLTNRDEMGFRMLLGRESFRSRFLVDAGKSFYGLKSQKKKKKGK